MLNHAWVRQAAVAVILASVSASSARAAAAESATFPGYTQPSEQRKLNFNGPGVVTKVHVKEGDLVKAGTLLAEQDDRVEQQHLKGVLIQANSDLQIVAADQTLEEKKVVAQRKEEMLAKNVVSQLEVLEARLDVKIAEARLELAKEEKLGKQTEAAEEEAKIAQKKLYATTDGIVQAVGVHEGELASNDVKNPVITMVTNEPLFVEVNLPVSETKSLQKHQKMQVRYEDEDNWLTAEIIFFDPVAIPGVRMQKTRLQLENPNHYRAGMNVLVKLGDKLAAAQPAR